MTAVVVQQVIEEKPFRDRAPDGAEVVTPIDYGAPNPNGFEVDNLYCKLAGAVQEANMPSDVFLIVLRG